MINIDEKYDKIDRNIIGRKQKLWLKKGEQQYLFKYGASNYEIYAELLAEQLGLQCGIDMAHYNVATYNGYIGLITPSFIRENELILSVEKLKKAVQYMFFENNISGDLRDNSIENILQAVYTYSPNIKISKIYDELMKRWLFYGLIMESDKNETNIAFLIGKNYIRLSPDYDNSTMARLNENIDSFLKNVRSESDIYSLTDNIKMSLNLKESKTDNFIVEFENFVKTHLEIANNLMQSFANIDLDKAIEICEKENDIEIPWNVKYWVKKTITLRLRDMVAILNRYNVKESDISKQKSL